MMRLLGFVLLVMCFGFGGALLIMLALGVGALIIKLLPFLLVFGLVTMVVRRAAGSEWMY